MAAQSDNHQVIVRIWLGRRCFFLAQAGLLHDPADDGSKHDEASRHPEHHPVPHDHREGAHNERDHDDDHRRPGRWGGSVVVVMFGVGVLSLGHGANIASNGRIALRGHNARNDLRRTSGEPPMKTPHEGPSPEFQPLLRPRLFTHSELP